MPDIDTEIAELKRRVAEAEKVRIKTELQLEAALQQVKQASQTLQEKFGVNDIEGARQLIQALEEQAAAKKATVEELMKKFEEAQ
jgi:hypothetical protein